MFEDEEPPIREFADRGSIWLLGSAATLRSFMALTAEEIIRNLDFARAVRVNRSFIPDDLRKRETDILYRIPYRDSDREIWLYLLTEHQGEPDPTMPWRILRIMVLIWEQQVRALIDANVPRREWKKW